MTKFQNLFQNSLLFSNAPTTLSIPIILLLLGIIFVSPKIIFLSLISFLFLLYFFRIPKITQPISLNNIISPASGKIIHFTKTDKYIHFAIFLSVFDTHLQYVCYDGYLSKKTYVPGTFKYAYLFQKSQYNERLIHEIYTKFGKMYVVQIAGMICRRIVSFLEPKSFIKQGDRLGLIKFGSRVDLIIPNMPHMNILKQSGDKVIGGETVLVSIENYNNDTRNDL